MKANTETLSAIFKKLEKAVNELEKAAGIKNDGSLVDRINCVAEKLNKLTDPKGRIVLQMYQNNALIFRPENKNEPFVVAYNYNPSTGDWSHGLYTSDIFVAWEKINADIIDGSTIVWSCEDIKARLDLFGIKPTPGNIKLTIEPYRYKPLNKCLRENGIKAGYDAMDEVINTIVAEDRYE